MNTYISFERAKQVADEKSVRTGWYFSVIEKMNIHTHDYEYHVIPHFWSEACYIAKPKA